jgi:hypothetical protein
MVRKMKSCEKNEIGIKKAYSYKIYSLSVIFTCIGFLLNILFIKYSVESLLLTFSSLQFKIFVLGYFAISIVLSIVFGRFYYNEESAAESCGLRSPVAGKIKKNQAFRRRSSARGRCFQAAGRARFPLPARAETAHE